MAKHIVITKEMVDKMVELSKQEQMTIRKLSEIFQMKGSQINQFRMYIRRAGIPLESLKNKRIDYIQMVKDVMKE